MEPIDIKSSTYVDFGVEINDKDTKFAVADQVEISKHKNFFAKGYIPNLSEEVFLWLKKLKTLYNGHM